MPAGLSGRWLRVDLPTTTGSAVLELVLYGSHSSEAAPSDSSSSTPALGLNPPGASPLAGGLEEAAAFPPVALSQLLGVNVVGAVSSSANLSLLAPYGAPVRIYSDWDWTEHVQGQSAFEPTADTGFMYDDYLAALGPGNNTEMEVGLGLSPHVVVQGTAGFVHGGNKTEARWKAMDASLFPVPGASQDPASYKDLAGHMFQWAARYGSNPKVDKSLLRLAPGQPPLVGSGLQPWLEVLNEPDGWWAGREAYYTPLEYAAALSASYDGHEGRLGPGMGIKAADSGLMVAQGG